MRLAQEAGWNPLEVERTAQDKKQWKSWVRKRVNHIRECNESQKNGWTGDRMARSEKMDMRESTKCEFCDKICKSRAGFAIHLKRMHSVEEKEFKCGNCGATFNQKATLKNHEKGCLGETSTTKYEPKTK